MSSSNPYSCLFLDIGGVLLSDGWDHHARRRAAEKFALNFAELNGRHKIVFAAFEEGRMGQEEYLDRVVFHQEREFTRAQFQKFMFAQSKPDMKMIGLARNLKTRFDLKVIVVSNESRELNLHRINTFKLNDLVDTFVSSCFVHVRKPDAEIFRLALDISQVPVAEIVYIENTQMFVEVAEDLGIRSILHTNFRSTAEKLSTLGLGGEKEVAREAS